MIFPCKDRGPRRERQKKPFTVAELVRIRLRCTIVLKFCFEGKTVLEICEFLRASGYRNVSVVAIRGFLNSDMPLLGPWNQPLGQVEEDCDGSH